MTLRPPFEAAAPLAGLAGEETADRLRDLVSAALDYRRRYRRAERAGRQHDAAEGRRAFARVARQLRAVLTDDLIESAHD